MKKYIIFFVVLILFTGCGGVNIAEQTNSAGFFSGIWDGWTVFFAFIGNMFGVNMNIYEVQNTGNWYNFGFLLGIGSWGIVSFKWLSFCPHSRAFFLFSKQITKYFYGKFLIYKKWWCCYCDDFCFFC